MHIVIPNFDWLKQVGSGVGLVGICLAHVKASKVFYSKFMHIVSKKVMDTQSFSNQVSKNCNSVLIIVHEKKDIHIARKEIVSSTS